MFWRKRFDNTFLATMESIERLNNTRETLLPEIKKFYDAVMELRNYPEYRSVISDPKYAEYVVCILVDTEHEVLDPYPDFNERIAELHEKYGQTKDTNLHMPRKERKALEADILFESEKLYDKLAEHMVFCMRAARELPRITWEVTQEMCGERLFQEPEQSQNNQLRRSEPQWSQLQFETMYTNISANIDRIIQMRNTLAGEVRKYFLAVDEMLKYPIHGIDPVEIDTVRERALFEALDPMFDFYHKKDMARLSSLYREAIFDRSHELEVLNVSSTIYNRIHKNIEMCAHSIAELENLCQKQVQAMRREAEVDQDHEPAQESNIFDIFKKMNPKEQTNEYERSISH